MAPHPRGTARRFRERTRVDAGDGVKPRRGHVTDEARRSQHARHVVDQKEEEAHAHEAQQNRDENVELRDGVVLDAGERGDRVEVREDEHRETDLQAPLAEHAGDDPRRQLTTRDLDGEEDHREREHDEPERRRDQRAERRPCPFGRESEESPARRRIEAADERRGHQPQHDPRERHDPQRRRQIAPDAVASDPAHGSVLIVRPARTRSQGEGRTL